MTKVQVVLIISSFLLLSCSNAYKNLLFIEEKDNIDFLSVFYDRSDAVAYDTEVAVASTIMSGLLIIKPLEEKENYRIVLTAKTGLKIFDFTMHKDSFIINYCMERLDRKIILNQLETDLHLLTDSHFNLKNVAKFKSENENAVVYRFRDGGDYLHYHFSEDGKVLKKIERGSKKRPKTIAEFHEYFETLPHLIILNHNIPVHLRLKLKWIPLSK